MWGQIMGGCIGKPLAKTCNGPGEHLGPQESSAKPKTPQVTGDSFQSTGRSSSPSGAPPNLLSVIKPPNSKALSSGISAVSETSFETAFSRFRNQPELSVALPMVRRKRKKDVTRAEFGYVKFAGRDPLAGGTDYVADDVCKALTLAVHGLQDLSLDMTVTERSRLVANLTQAQGLLRNLQDVRSIIDAVRNDARDKNIGVSDTKFYGIFDHIALWALDQLRKNNKVLLPVDFYGANSSHATLLYITKEHNAPDYKMHYIDTEAHGATDESLAKAVVDLHRVDKETGIMDYGALIGEEALQTRGAKPVGQDLVRRRIFSVRSTQGQFMNSRSVEKQRQDVEALREILAAGIVKRHATYGDSRKAVIRALNSVAFTEHPWVIGPQRPIKIQRETYCEFTSIQAFCSLLFGNESTYQVAKLFMTRHATQLISKKDVRAALDFSAEIGPILEPSEVHLNAQQLDANLATRHKRTTSKLAVTRQLAASKTGT